jgi:nucleotide-binding universal stress UspA family protein
LADRSCAAVEGLAGTQNGRKFAMIPESTILVGVSGSPASLTALRWAAGEAERRECRLRIVTVWQREQRASYAQLADDGATTDKLEQARCVLTATVRAVLGSGPWRNTTLEAIEGKIEQVLVAASEDADLLVLGSGSTAVVGPVVRTCLTDARCPVVAVSRRAKPAMVLPGDHQQVVDEIASRREYHREPLPAGTA